PLAGMVDREVHGDPVDPGVEARLEAERVQAAVRLDERLLGHVAGVLPVAEHAVDHGVDPALVLLDEPAVGRPVATLDRLEHLAIGLAARAALLDPTLLAARPGHSPSIACDVRR